MPHTEIKVKPRNDHRLHCPFCDTWKHNDSMVGRKGLGIHLVDDHPEEVRFHKSKKPPPLEDY